MVLVGGRVSVRNTAETFGFGLRKPTGGVGRTRLRVKTGGPVGLVKGQVVIVDDTVYHDAPGRREPPRTTGPTVTPAGGSRGPGSSRS